MVQLPPIPAKRYFTISEVAQLCDVKPHVLRYWEQEFVQLRPMKRRGNRRYYQHHELLMVRRIRALLYDEGFTIQGARNQLRSHRSTGTDAGNAQNQNSEASCDDATVDLFTHALMLSETDKTAAVMPAMTHGQIKHELLQIRSLLAL